MRFQQRSRANDGSVEGHPAIQQKSVCPEEVVDALAGLLSADREDFEWVVGGRPRPLPPRPPPFGSDGGWDHYRGAAPGAQLSFAPPPPGLLMHRKQIQP